jgi:hypothetical protein
VEQTDKSELFATSRVEPSEQRENSEQHQLIVKQGQFTRKNVIDVFGKETEPICDYLRCHHKFSVHGLGKLCECKHPRNTTIGA